MNFNAYAGMIANSGSDERGKYSGGRPGDQTGREWQVRTWYNRPWNCVLRYPDAKVGEKIAELSIKAAKNNLIGYNQANRDSYWQHLKASNYDPLQITIACDADCSAGVIANTRAAGYVLGISALKNINASYTGNMRSGFRAAGFQVLTDSKYLTSAKYLLPGDILLNDRSHTAVNLGKGAAAQVSRTSNSAQSSNISGAREVATKFSKSIAGTYFTTDTLNLRSGAGTNKSIITTVPKGQSISCYGYYTEVSGTNWYYVTYNNITGFVSSRYLTGTKTKIVPISSSNRLNVTPQATGTVTASSLNVRTWAGTNSALLKSYPRLNKGNRIEICDTVKASDNSDWYYIRIAGKYYGFVSAKYVKKD